MKPKIEYFSQDNSEDAEKIAREKQRLGLCTGLGNLLNLIPSKLRDKKIEEMKKEGIEIDCTVDPEKTVVYNVTIKENVKLSCLRNIFDTHLKPFIFALWLSGQSVFLYDTNQDATSTLFQTHKLFPRDLFEVNGKKIQGGLIHPSQFEENNIVSSQVKGKLIVLNGASSAGKSSIAENLLNIFYEKENEVWLHIGMDEYMRMMDQKENCWPKTTQTPCNGFYWTEKFFEEENKSLPVLNSGEYGKEILESMCISIAHLLDQGINIVTNYVNFQDFSLEKLIEKITVKNKFEYEIFNIYAEKRILNEREKNRNNRIVGSALAQFYTVCNHNLKSTTINNGLKSNSSEEATEKIYAKTKKSNHKRNVLSLILHQIKKALKIFN